MAQHDMILDNAPGLTFRTDLNAALAAAVTVSAGAIEPPTKYPGMLWLDLSIAPNGGLRMRNQANSAWVPVVFATEPVAGAAASPLMSAVNSIYSGSDAANVSFPVGTTLLCKHTANVGRNVACAVKISATAGWYDLSGSTALSGSWRARGCTGASTDWTFLAQRIS